MFSIGGSARVQLPKWVGAGADRQESSLSQMLIAPTGSRLTSPAPVTSRARTRSPAAFQVVSRRLRLGCLAERFIS